MRDEPSILHADVDSFFASVEQRLRSAASRQGGDRRRRRGHGGQLRGEGVRDPRRHGRLAGAGAVPPGDRRRPALRRVRGREQGAVRPVPQHRAGGRGAVDGGGVPRRQRPRADLRLPHARSPSGCGSGFAPSSTCRSASASRGPRRSPRWRAAPPSPTACCSSRPAREREFLHPLPVGALWGVGEATAKRIARLGVRTVGELADVPEASLIAALGRHSGSHLHALANLREHRPLKPHRRRRSYGSQSALGSRPKSMHEIERSLAKTVERASRRMRGAHRSGRTVTVRLRFGDYTRASRSRTLPRATAATEPLLEAAAGLLGEAKPLIEARGLTLVGVTIGNLDDAAAGVQLELPFDGAGTRGAGRGARRRCTSATAPPRSRAGRRALARRARSRPSASRSSRRFAGDLAGIELRALSPRDRRGPAREGTRRGIGICRRSRSPTRSRSACCSPPAIATATSPPRDAGSSASPEREARACTRS